MIKMLKDKLQFKNENLNSWVENTEYWLNSSLRQVEDTKDFFRKKLKELLFDGCTVYDLGCGSGWLIDFIAELNISVKFVGIDFNEKFIQYLREKHTDTSHFEFVLADLEKPLEQVHYGKADFVFSNFNFFEIADLPPAFENAYKLLNNNGSLIISTIDVTYLIVAISNNYDEFKKNLIMYEEAKAEGKVPYFFQPIDLGNSASTQLKYASVLYSFADYFKLAKSKGLVLQDFDEVICASRYIPKIYQYMQFSK